MDESLARALYGSDTFDQMEVFEDRITVGIGFLDLSDIHGKTNITAGRRSQEKNQLMGHYIRILNNEVQ